MYSRDIKTFHKNPKAVKAHTLEHARASAWDRPRG